MLNPPAFTDTSYILTYSDAAILFDFPLHRHTSFKEKLGRLSTKQMCREAKDRRAGSLGFAEAMLLYYNKKSRSPLKWEKLYSHKTAKKRAAPEIPVEEESEAAPEEMGQLNIFDAEDKVSE